MAQKGQRFEMPDGSAYIVEVPGSEVDGEYVQMEFVLPAGSFAPPPHVHPSQVEEYEVITGRFEVMVDGVWTSIGPGESAAAPIGALHTFRNPTDGEVRVRNWHRPAMRFEDFLELAHTNLRAAGITSGRDPRVPMIISAAFFRFPETLAPARARERIPMRIMAGLGRLLRLAP